MTARPRIVFLVMSAVQSAAVVDQLARALAPHTVLVHHDFSQTPAFELEAPNVRFVPDPRRTGWAFFGFVEGIFHSMRHALAELEFDYLQLLSPGCLPIRPLAQFEQHVGAGAAAHFGCIDLFADRDALMSVGWRAFAPANTLRQRVIRRLSRIYFGATPGRRDVAGIWLRSGADTNARGTMTLRARAALGVLTALGDPRVGRHVFDANLRPYYGGTWFGARRHVVAEMVAAFEQPQIHDYFSRLHIADEFLIPTLLMKILGGPGGPINHYIHRFEEARSGTIGVDDIRLLRASNAFFARKFPDDPAAPVRARVLAELAGANRAAGEGASAITAESVRDCRV